MYTRSVSSIFAIFAIFAVIATLAPAALAAPPVKQADPQRMPAAASGSVAIAPGQAAMPASKKLDPRSYKGPRIPEGMDIQRPAERNGMATIWHVSALDGFNGADGLSWAQPFPSLTFATFVAQPGDEIWVDAYTTYSPSDFYIANGPGASREDSFEIPSGVTVRGGFAGSETIAAQRSPINFTTLSAGQFNYHVLEAWSAAGVVLDHFYIENGVADGPTDADRFGGGMIAVDSDVTFIDCFFQFNTAQSGGGLWTQNSDITFDTTVGFPLSYTFNENSATDTLALGNGFGGGMFMGFGSTLTINTQLAFGLNTAIVGGGIDLQQVTVNPSGSSILLQFNAAVTRADTTGGFGGGMNLFIDPDATAFDLPRVEMVQNSAEFGGGILVTNDGVTPGTLTLSPQSRIVDCQANQSGGGLYVGPQIAAQVPDSEFFFCTATNGGAIFTEGTLMVAGSLFSGNMVADSGGAIFNQGDLQVADSLFEANNAGNDGGAIFTEGELEVVDSEFDSNTTFGAGGAIAANPTSAITIDSSSFTRNEATDTGGDIVIEGAGPNAIRRSSITDSRSFRGALLVANSAGVNLQNLVVRGSEGPAIFAENNTTVTGAFLTLYANFESIKGSTGATVTISNSVIHNNLSAIDPNNGTINISDSIVEGGYAGTNIIDADPLINGGGKLTKNSPAIDAGNGIGAFGIPLDRDGNARERDDTEQPDTGTPGFSTFVPDMGAFEFQGTSDPLFLEVPTDEPTIADAMARLRNTGTIQLMPGQYVECFDTQGKNLNIVSVDPFDSAVVNSTILACGNGSAFTVSGGSQVVVDGLTLFAAGGGPALLVDDGRADVFRSSLFGDHIGGNGGGAYIESGASAGFIDSLIDGSRALRGGGIYAAGDVTVEGCRILGCRVTGSSGAAGAGVFVGSTGTISIDRTEISRNLAEFNASNNIFTEGGGVLIEAGGSAVIRNSVISDNTAWGGGGVYSFDGQLTMLNVTVAGNNAGSDAGGLKLFGGNMVADISNSIVSGNTDPNPGGDDDFLQFLGAVVNIEYSNIGSVPASGTNQSADPLFVDALLGDFRLSGRSPSIDAGSNALYTAGVLDLDLLPRFQDDTGTPDTGAGTAPVIDQGAYEFQGTTVCLADTNGDGILDNGDISTFVQLFIAQDITAEMNGDGILDNGDIITFVSLYLAGC